MSQGWRRVHAEHYPARFCMPIPASFWAFAASAPTSGRRGRPAPCSRSGTGTRTRSRAAGCRECGPRVSGPLGFEAPDIARRRPMGQRTAMESPWRASVQMRCCADSKCDSRQWASWRFASGDGYRQLGRRAPPLAAWAGRQRRGLAAKEAPTPVLYSGVTRKVGQAWPAPRLFPGIFWCDADHTAVAGMSVRTLP